MDFLTAKATYIAVGVFISLGIASAVLFTLNQMQTVYKGVFEKDVSIRGEFAEFAMYDETILNGLEMYNTAKKYKDSNTVLVVLGGAYINRTTWINRYDPGNIDTNSILYQVSVVSRDDITTITFRGR